MNLKLVSPRTGRPMSVPLLAYMLGEKQLIPLDGQKRSEDVIKEVSTYINKIGYNPDTLAFVPIFGRNGANMLETSADMAWFKGWKVTPKDDTPVESHCWNKPLYPALEHVCRIGDTGSVPVGQVETTGVSQTSEEALPGTSELQCQEHKMFIFTVWQREPTHGNSWLHSLDMLDCHVAHIACKCDELRELSFWEKAGRWPLNFETCAILLFCDLTQAVVLSVIRAVAEKVTRINKVTKSSQKAR
ncbi:Elongation factor 1-alpha 1 [Galemys pyrenaicus]|uniref:Elongation factor 1-alpha 1 n=1 Tax=Galemys pyrenaicus TaxID=202257 RepID=A0A8J6AYP4_GALPY|nr:Elongation factor 1-alpha 1 [Galemys pyrenaicus]